MTDEEFQAFEEWLKEYLDIELQPYQKDYLKYLDKKVFFNTRGRRF